MDESIALVDFSKHGERFWSKPFDYAHIEVGLKVWNLHRPADLLARSADASFLSVGLPVPASVADRGGSTPPVLKRRATALAAGADRLARRRAAAARRGAAAVAARVAAAAAWDLGEPELLEPGHAARNAAFRQTSPLWRSDYLADLGDGLAWRAPAYYAALLAFWAGFTALHGELQDIAIEEACNVVLMAAASRLQGALDRAAFSRHLSTVVLAVLLLGLFLVLGLLFAASRAAYALRRRLDPGRRARRALRRDERSKRHFSLAFEGFREAEGAQRAESKRESDGDAARWIRDDDTAALDVADDDGGSDDELLDPPDIPRSPPGSQGPAAFWPDDDDDVSVVLEK